MNQEKQLVVFSIDHHKFAIDIDSVERIIRAVEVTPVPDTPNLMTGVVNIEGTVIPVLNLRRRLGFPDRDLLLDDMIVVMRRNGALVAGTVDNVEPVMKAPEEACAAGERQTLQKDFTKNILVINDEIIVLLDVEGSLIPEDQCFV
jgi:purine-binding chemotaxis protein CheW